MKRITKKLAKDRPSAGSTLILAVVLTSLLAIVGVLFVMVARVDKIATSAISDNKELNLAVDTVIAKISEQLVSDTPGVQNPLIDEGEYYDYPDANNLWLASLEPYDDVGYRWRQISDIGFLGGPLGVPAQIVPYSLDAAPWQIADADGDGVSDSLWIVLPDMTSSKGQPIYAAIRIIDNGAMLNANTGFMFDPADSRERIDGSSPMQINLAALSQRGANGTLRVAADYLQVWRCGTELPDLSLYEQNVVWRYNEPNGLYAPFDISDELELRNRFLMNHPSIDVGIEEVWDNAFQNPNLRAPVTSTSDLTDWFYRAQHDVLGPNDIYSYRHLATDYNMDRIIGADGGKMANINTADVNSLYGAIRAGLWDAAVPAPNSMAAQMAVNLSDYRDDDNDVSTILVDGAVYYGFERPCFYISELVYNSASVNDVSYMSYAIELYNDYSGENNPFDIMYGDWQLVIQGYGDNPVNVSWSGTREHHVIRWQDPNAPLGVTWYDPNEPNPADEARGVDPNVVLSWPGSAWAVSYDVYFGTDFIDVNNAGTAVFRGNQGTTTYDPCSDPCRGLEYTRTYYWRIDDVNVSTQPGEVWSFTTGDANFISPEVQDISGAGTWLPGEPVFGPDSLIELQRRASDGSYVVVDSYTVPAWLFTAAGTSSCQRDTTIHKCTRRLWAAAGLSSTLGHINGFEDPDADMIQAHPTNERFTNIGEIGSLFRNPLPFIEGAVEADVRIDLAYRDYQRVFNYLTVFDPANDGINNDGDLVFVAPYWVPLIDAFDVDGPELKVPGRININTAPWYVIAQLPWMTPEIAQAVVDYRDTVSGGFESIGELMQVAEMGLYASGDGDQPGFPDLTADDGAADDFEERDLLFARLSNLVTVRSDVFTAYILVRIGAAGPQKRVIAILDRSNVYADGAGGVMGKVKVRALHPVADPR